MRSPRTRVLATIAIMAVFLGLAAPIARAATAPVATATVDKTDVLAGTQQTFNVTVSQPLAALLGTGVDAVRINVPSDVTILGGSGGTGWDTSVSTSKRTIFFFRQASGAPINANQSRPFSIVTDIGRPATDVTFPWSVATSIDGGKSYTGSTTATGGTLNTLIRTLDVLSISMTAPTQLVGESPLTVTQGQNNAQALVRVNNVGGAAQTVTTTLAGAGSNTDTRSIASLEITEVPFNLAFPNSNGSLNADAQNKTGAGGATISDAVNETLGFTAQGSFDAAFVSSSLFPKDVVPGRSYNIGFTINPGGAVAGTGLSGSMSFAAGAISASLVSPTELAGTAPNTPLVFTGVTVPAIADNSYNDGTFNISGVDSNGFPINLTNKPISEALTVDSRIPIPEPTIDVPAPKVPGEPKAATNGTTVTFGGRIVDNGAGCGTCTVTSAVLQHLDATGAVIGSTDVTSNLQVSSAPATVGNISGSRQVATWTPASVNTRLLISAVDRAGLGGDGGSSLVNVDIVAPTVVGGETGGPDKNNPDFKRIDIRYNEPVIMFNALGAEADYAVGDWTCDGFTVLDAEKTADRKGAVLTLDKDLGRDERPSCRYRPNGERLQDRVALTLIDTTLSVADGIMPGAAILDSVNDEALIDGEFWTNASTPTVKVTNVGPNYTVFVYEKTDSGLVEVGKETAGGAEVDILLSSLGGTDRKLTLVTKAVDGSNQAGQSSEYPLNLDFTAPSVSTASKTRTTGTTNVVLTFAERLIGDGRAADWTVLGPNGRGGVQEYTVGDVTISGDGATVTLAVGDTNFSITTVANGVRYEVQPPTATTRLRDRAGNFLGDATSTF